MKLHVFAIYDIAAAAFMPPFYYPTKLQAIRAFTNLVNDHQSPVSQHPKDYRLFMLGEFNDEAGQFKNLDQPELLTNAPDVIRREEERPTPLRLTKEA